MFHWYMQESSHAHGLVRIITQTHTPGVSRSMLFEPDTDFVGMMMTGRSAGFPTISFRKIQSRSLVFVAVASSCGALHGAGSTEDFFCASTLPGQFASVQQPDSRCRSVPPPPPLPASALGFTPQVRVPAEPPLSPDGRLPPAEAWPGRCMWGEVWAGWVGCVAHRPWVRAWRQSGLGSRVFRSGSAPKQW